MTEPKELPVTDYRYWAFISYSSKDEKWARWLHRAIESSGVPSQLVNYPTPTGDPAPRRFFPVFRDCDEQSASADLGAQIEEVLRASRYLIVICSPNASKSSWINKEIETFQTLGRRDRILAVVVDGEPNSGNATECFPPALRQFEPIAVDARPEGDGKTHATLKILAGMLGVSFDALRNRESQRRVRRLQLIIVAMSSLLVPVVLGFWKKPELALTFATMALLPIAVIVIWYGVVTVYFFAKYRYAPALPTAPEVPSAKSISKVQAPSGPPEPSQLDSDFIFISYKREDLPRIVPFMHRIVNWGYAIWYDRGIPGGAEWDSLIEEKVIRCKILLVFLSQEAVESKWVRREIKFADSEDRPILGIRLDKAVELKYGLKVVMNQYQMIDASNADFSDELRKAIEYVRLL